MEWDLSGVPTLVLDKKTPRVPLETAPPSAVCQGTVAFKLLLIAFLDQLARAFTTVSPMSAGLLQTWIPADFRASIFSLAVP